VLCYKVFGYSLLASWYSKYVSTISTINNVFSVQLRLACREFVIELLNYVLQLYSFSDQRLLLLLFQDHKTFHVEEKKRTQHLPTFFQLLYK